MKKKDKTSYLCSQYKKKAMKSVKIIINELGAIRDSVVELSPVMLFSGESGLGKSYLAILCHYVFDMLLDEKRLNRFVKENGWSFSKMRPGFKNEGTAITVNKSALEEWLAKDAIQYLRYMLNNDKMTADIRIVLPAEIDEHISIDYEEEIGGIENDEEVYIKLLALDLIYRIKEESIDDESPFATLLRYGLIKVIFGDFKALKETYVFPPSRGPMLTEDITPRTGLYEKFRNDLLRMNRIPPHAEQADPELVRLLANVLEGTVNRTTDTYQYHYHGKQMPISAAAASIREIAPLAMLVERTDISKVAMMIEEPEAHLHPLKQRTMADVTSVMCSAGAYMQITSHSDYYLRRINELISLKKLHERMGDGDEFEAVCRDVDIDKLLAFDYSRLSAYVLLRQANGTSKVEKQSLDDGVPFASFSDAIDDSLRSRYRLSEYAEKYGCN